MTDNVACRSTQSQLLSSHYLILLKKKLQRRIRECEAEIETIKTLPYYRIFNRYGEQERDLRAVELKLEKLKAILNRE